MVLVFIAFALLKFVPHVFWYRAYRSGRTSRSKPLRGGTTLAYWQSEPDSQTQEEINAERLVAYRLSGAGLIVLCLIGGVALLALGLVQMPGFRLSLGDPATAAKNAAPGIVAMILGLLVWQEIRR